MSLNTILAQLLNRSRINPGKVYSARLEHGLTVAFRTKSDHTTMQISRQKPTEPSYLELVTCLKAIDVTDPEIIPSRKLEDTSNFYLLVDLVNQGN